MSDRVQTPMPAEHQALNDAIRRAAGRLPAEQARDEEGKFTAPEREPASMHGGARMPRAEQAFDMNREIRRAAGKYVGPGRRATNGISLEQ